jgi:hypothetical protein
MVSVMAIEIEACGSCVEDKNVSKDIKNAGAGL